MKRHAVWVIALSVLLLFAACSGESSETAPTDFRVACFGCKQEVPMGQLNVDFGLCPDCMMKVGAAYCQGCAAPCYTRDMIQGLCSSCCASASNTAASSETAAPVETTVPPEHIRCEYCGHLVHPDYLIGVYCVGCYAIREEKCLRCTYNSRLTEGCHCEHCSQNWFYCAGCSKRTAGYEMFLDLCMDCYRQLNSILVPCLLCNESIAPAEIKDKFCSNCYTEPTSEPEIYTCDSCGREIDNPEDCHEGKCWGCYNEDKNLCVSCQKRPSEGYGPSAMECAQCYYESNATCPGCGYDYWKDDMIGDYCSSCYYDGLIGTYYDHSLNIKIVVTSHEDYDYCMSYTDCSLGITLRNIPLAYENSDASASKSLMFQLNDYYPGYGGYVEICMYIGARAEYSYNALIDGMVDSGGYYSSLSRE